MTEMMTLLSASGFPPYSSRFSFSENAPRAVITISTARRNAKVRAGLGEQKTTPRFLGTQAQNHPTRMH